MRAANVGEGGERRCFGLGRLAGDYGGGSIAPQPPLADVRRSLKKNKAGKAYPMSSNHLHRLESYGPRWTGRIVPPVRWCRVAPKN